MSRRRRSPEEARDEILAAAESRLRRHGIAGLSVADVAADCGMSHATVIHHFGSTAGMRRALVTRMSDRLLRDIIEALRAERSADSAAILEDLFETLSGGGHAKLLAWLSIGGDELADDLAPSPDLKALFTELVPALARRLPEGLDRDAVARRMILLIASAAIGYGVAGETLPTMIGMERAEAHAFPQWLGDQIDALLQGRS